MDSDVSSRRKKRRGKDLWSPTPAQSAVAAILRGPTAAEEFDVDELAESLDADADEGLADMELEELLNADAGRTPDKHGNEPVVARGGTDAAESGPESAEEHIAALLDELQEKDALVAALTAQLEEAADRLDRLHRAGADRLSPSAGMEAGRTEGSPELAQEVARLTAAWGELRAGDALDEIGRKLDDIIDALSRPGPAVAPRETLVPAMPRVSEPPAARAGWEEMKAQLLRNEADHDRSGDAGAPARTPNVNDSSADILSQLPLDPPASIELDGADRESLVAAVEERDVFISHLIRRLRSGPAGRYEPIDWTALATAPDDLRERLQELEARLQELLRMEECDLSLERARLARERARLEQLRREVERDTRAEAAALNQSGESASQSERRWLRAFGFGRKQDRSFE